MPNEESEIRQVRMSAHDRPHQKPACLSEPSVPPSIEYDQTAQDHQGTTEGCWFAGHMQEAAADVPERGAVQTQRHDHYPAGRVQLHASERPDIGTTCTPA